MKTSSHNRRTYMLMLIVVLIGSAVFCGRSQPASPEAPQPPPAGEQPGIETTPGGGLRQAPPGCHGVLVAIHPDTAWGDLPSCAVVWSGGRSPEPRRR